MFIFQAVSLYRKSAEKGHSRSQFLIGECYQDGSRGTVYFFDQVIFVLHIFS